MGLLDLGDIEKRVNARMVELNDTLEKNVSKLSHDIGESSKPLIAALEENTEAVKELTKELKKAKKKKDDE